MIDLHYWPTPNGKKVTILLEECGLEYKIVPCNIQRGDQFTPEFLKMNPNHRMPVMVDHDPKGGGAPISVFESGAIMMYIAEKVGRFWPQDVRGKYEVNQWVMWQMANQGPKLGECGHFRRAGPEAGGLSYAIRRFTAAANPRPACGKRVPEGEARRRVRGSRARLVAVAGRTYYPG